MKGEEQLSGKKENMAWVKEKKEISGGKGLQITEKKEGRGEKRPFLLNLRGVFTG